MGTAGGWGKHVEGGEGRGEGGVARVVEGRERARAALGWGRRVWGKRWEESWGMGEWWNGGGGGCMWRGERGAEAPSRV